MERVVKTTAKPANGSKISIQEVGRNDGNKPEGAALAGCCVLFVMLYSLDLSDLEE